MNYYADMEDAHLFDLLRQAYIKTENQLIVFSDSGQKNFPDTGRSTGTYIIFYRGGTIDHGKHVPVIFSQSIAESYYNAEFTAGMALAHSRMLLHEFLNKDLDIVIEEAPIIMLDRKSFVRMSMNGKDTNHTKHNAKIVCFVRNGEKCKLDHIEWCEGGLQLSYIATMNGGGNDLDTIMKYIMGRLDN